MPYIEAHQELRDHPKIKRAGRVLGVSKAQMVGHLICLWWWCLDYAEDGNLSDFNNADIAEASEWEGDPDTFVSALLNCGPADRAGFLVDTGDGLEINDWAEYGGKYITKRNQGRKRQREFRLRNAGVTTSDVDVTQSNALLTRDKAVSNATREEDSRVEERKEKDTTEDPDFAAAVAAWHSGGQMLSKTIADDIGLAIDDWRELGPPGYVADAITEATRQGKLNWKYVEAILKRCAMDHVAPIKSKNGTDPTGPIVMQTKQVIWADGSTEEREVATRGL